MLIEADFVVSDPYEQYYLHVKTEEQGLKRRQVFCFKSFMDQGVEAREGP